MSGNNVGCSGTGSFFNPNTQYENHLKQEEVLGRPRQSSSTKPGDSFRSRPENSAAQQEFDEFLQSKPNSVRSLDVPPRSALERLLTISRHLAPVVEGSGLPPPPPSEPVNEIFEKAFERAQASSGQNILAGQPAENSSKDKQIVDGIEAEPNRQFSENHASEQEIAQHFGAGIPNRPTLFSTGEADRLKISLGKSIDTERTKQQSPIENSELEEETSFARLLTQQAGNARSLQDVIDVLGTPRDAAGKGGSGILKLPKSLQFVPLRQLNLCPIHVPWGERAQVNLILARATVGTGADPEAMENLTRCFSMMPASSEALAALRVLWGPVNTLPLANRLAPLYGLSTSIKAFPLNERTERFGEHLAAWEDIVEENPISLRATPRLTSPLDGVLPNMVAVLPPEFQDEARERIAAMKARVNFSAG